MVLKCFAETPPPHPPRLHPSSVSAGFNGKSRQTDWRLIRGEANLFKPCFNSRNTPSVHSLMLEAPFIGFQLPSRSERRNPAFEIRITEIKRSN